MILEETESAWYLRFERAPIASTRRVSLDPFVALDFDIEGKLIGVEGLKDVVEAPPPRVGT